MEPRTGLARGSHTGCRCEGTHRRKRMEENPAADPPASTRATQPLNFYLVRL